MLLGTKLFGNTIWSKNYDPFTIAIRYTSTSEVPYYITITHIGTSATKAYQETLEVVRMLNSGIYDGLDPAKFCKEILG